MKPYFNRFLSTSITAVVALSSSAWAVQIYKDVATSDINTVANWSTTTGAATPDPASIGTTDTLRFNEYFAPTSGTNFTAQLSSALVAGTIRVDSGSSGGGSAFGNVIINGNPLTLNGNNDYNTGYLSGIVLNSGAGGSLMINADIVVGSNQRWVSSRNLTIGGNVNLGTSVLTLWQAGGTGTIAGIISGDGSLVKDISSGGQTILTNSNTHTGGTTVTMGTLVLGHASNTLADNGAITVNGGTLSLGANSDTVGAVTLTSGSITGSGTLTGTSYSASAGTISAMLAGTGVSFSKSTSGTVAIDSTDNSFSGTVTLVGGTTTITKLANGGSTSSLGRGSSPIVLNGGTLSTSTTGVGGTTDRAIEMRAGAGLSSNGTGAISFTALNVSQTLDASARTLTLSGSNTNANTFGSILGDSGTGANITTLTKSETGTWVLTGANNYTGSTIINQGVLRIIGTAVLGGKTGSTGDANNIVFGTSNANATLEFETNANLGSADQVRFRNTGGTAGTGGNLKYIGTTAQTVSKAIQCDSSIGIRLSSDSVGGSVEFSGSWAASSSSRPVYLGGTGTGDNTISRSIIGSTLTKTDSGRWILSGTNTYTGTTAVNAGTLKVTGSIGDSVVTVNHAGTVLASGATGTIGKGVTVNSGAILAAGGKNAVGTATVGSAGLSFANGSIFEWDLATSKDADGVGVDDGAGGTDFDSLSVAGPLGAATTGAIFKLIFGTGALADVTNTGNEFWNTPYGTQQWNMSAIFGKAFDTNAFSSVQTSTDVSAYGSFTITGSTLTWTAVPEPRTAFVGLLLAGGLLRRRRS